MVDLAYRALGLLVQARYQIALLVGVANAIFLLLEVRLWQDAPSFGGALGFFDSPLLLTAAVLLIAQLPPGVVFRAVGHRPTAPAAAPGSAPVSATPRAASPDGQWGCRVSAQLREGDSQEWRLLAPSTLQVTAWGGVEVSVPTYAVRPRWPSMAPLSVRTLDWYRPFGVRPPLWGMDPLPAQRRRERREPAPVVAGVARLAIPARARAEVVAGWQYAGLRCYPALRLTHHGEDGRPQFTYLAFSSVAARDAVVDRLA